MARWTTYTSTISVPIYASWKCSKCGEVNFSQGIIQCQREVMTSARRSSKLEEAKQSAQESAETQWVDNALKIIYNPQENAQEVRSGLFLQNTKCTNCKTKPKWDKGTGYLAIFGLAIMAMIISGIAAFALRTSVVAWIIFSLFTLLVVYCFITEKLFKKTMREMPKEELPVIGSINEELIEAAKERGKVLLTPEETIEQVKSLE